MQQMLKDQISFKFLVEEIFLIITGLSVYRLISAQIMTLKPGTTSVSKLTFVCE